MNSVTLTGNIGGEIVTREVNGTMVAKFSIATNERWTDRKTGQTNTKTDWHRVSAWGDGLVKFLSEYAGKGSRVGVFGRLTYRQYTDNQGVERTVAEIVARSVEVYTTKKNGTQDTEIPVVDDEIPF